MRSIHIQQGKKKSATKVQDESLITQLSINPIVATQNETIQVSMHTKANGKLSIELVKGNEIIQTAFSKRIVKSGFHYQVAEFDTKDLANGTYEIRASLQTHTRKDSDTVSLYVNNLSTLITVFSEKSQQFSLKMESNPMKVKWLSWIF